jgi:hypothetical protein
MTRDADNDKAQPRRMQSGARGAGGPPPNIPYGGQARVVYTPPGRSESAPAAPPSRPAAEPSDSGSGPAKKIPASRSRYGGVAPGRPLTAGRARIFAGEVEVRLEKPPHGDPDAEWPMYVSTEKVAGTADRSVLNGVYIHRSWLPDPLPERLRLRFEPA